MASLDQFRAKTREWLEANCPESMRRPANEEETVGGGRKQEWRNAEAKVWLERMVEKGWTAPTWPKEYGGGGLSAQENLILLEEMRRIDARAPIGGMGFSMIGPTLLEYGTDDQKMRHLPRITSGEIRWCQGYSEPNAGSDLANVQTKAVDNGDYFIVNGQKIWTSGAHMADWIFALVRTDPDAPKHDGISFLLIDMDQPGVTTRPIRLISGNSPFCETFFDNAVARKDDLVGKLNQGWTVGKRLLQHERSSLSGLGSGGTRGRYDDMGELHDLAKQYVGVKDGKLADLSLRGDIIRNRMNAEAFRLTQRRSGEENRSGGTPSFATSMFKYYASENGKERLELQLKVMGTQSFGWEGDEFSAGERQLTHTWLRSKSSTIAGGSSEIQLNIISKRVLGLPDGDSPPSG